MANVTLLYRLYRDTTIRVNIEFALYWGIKVKSTEESGFSIDDKKYVFYRFLIWN